MSDHNNLVKLNNVEVLSGNRNYLDWSYQVQVQTLAKIYTRGTGTQVNREITLWSIISNQITPVTGSLLPAGVMLPANLTQLNTDIMLDVSNRRIIEDRTFTTLNNLRLALISHI